ncbi:Crp/Fnr family transcriptional regulator [Rufibacter tibetensis]|uniref:Crp/Fnr family transcriptional regulator n=2 Tax=Rufibacter tibetensis TaxID=512763 RepID=A0A0P0CW52_9BACT|nr:Crp/Fnr family transcriptional regulator [Rufibacter tibetensis]
MVLMNCSTRKEMGGAPDLPSLLVFYKTAGYYHTSIPSGLAALQKLGAENGFKVDTTNNAAKFVQDTLQKYDAVVFLSTTQDVLNDTQQQAFEQFIRGGGGFVGIHAATDTEYNWPWYNQLVGAYFDSHPEIQTATIQVVDKSHLSTSFLPDKWERKDEWYNFKNINPDVKVLANLDETSYKGGKNGQNHPIAWYHTFEGARVFYTGGGHTNESFQEPLFLRHLLGGIQYVLQKE